MSALTQKRTPKLTSKSSIPLSLVAGGKATQGGMACLDTTAAIAKSGASGNANLIRVGVWAESVDNTAGGSATNVMCDLDHEIWGQWFDNATGGAAIGASQLYTTSAYILDDHTIGTTSSGNSSAGRVWEISPDGLKVFVEEYRI
jgi:hypothetical protein